jgi:hypothetical protein
VPNFVELQRYSPVITGQKAVFIIVACNGRPLDLNLDNKEFAGQQATELYRGHTAMMDVSKDGTGPF